MTTSQQERQAIGAPLTEERVAQPWVPLQSVPPGQRVLTGQGLVGIRLEERWPGETVWVYVVSGTDLYRLHKSHPVQPCPTEEPIVATPKS